MAPVEEVRRKFVASGHAVLCSADREYTRIEWIQRIADKMMTDDFSFSPDKFPTAATCYRRLNSGLIIGYAGALRDVLIGARKLIAPGIRNDQTPLTKYYLQHPDEVALDTRCAIFQSLVRTRESLMGGSISGNDWGPDVHWEQRADGTRRLRNLMTGEYPCIVHGYRNLDMTPLVAEAGYMPPPYTMGRKLRHFRNHVIYYVKRSLPFAARSFLHFLAAVSNKGNL
jgi:hypothetical protein